MVYENDGIVSLSPVISGSFADFLEFLGPLETEDSIEEAPVEATVVTEK